MAKVTYMRTAFYNFLLKNDEKKQENFKIHAQMTKFACGEAYQVETLQIARNRRIPPNWYYVVGK